ncbi:MAG: xylulokinase [bacterium]
MSDNTIALGIELSTQSAKWIALEINTAQVIGSASIAYDQTFPAYETVGGVLKSSDTQRRESPTAMFLDALDEVFASMVRHDIELHRVASIKCDAQQHATVYAADTLARRLSSIDPSSSLARALSPCLTRKLTPIWEDRTTETEAQAMTERLAGDGGIQALTGNRAELRFPAAQILKWAKESPEQYAKTSHIMLLSAFITSALAGVVAPVDTGDGWGTNLNSIDVDQPAFSERAIGALSEQLAADIGENGLQVPSSVPPAEQYHDLLAGQLGRMVAYDTPIGPVSTYFVEKYGVAPEAIVLAGTGDNPATLLGCGDGALVSLGSSYTVCGPMDEVHPVNGATYNIFGYRPGFAMALAVITNGGKLHKQFCDAYAGGDWARYADLAGDSIELPEEEPLMLPYLSDESVPVAKAGIVRDGFTESDARANVRALHLSQVASLRLHSRHLSDVPRLCVVGGGASNRFIRQALADAFGAITYTITNAEFAAPYGAAMSAARYALGVGYDAVSKRFVQSDPDSECHPSPGNAALFDRIIARYEKLESDHLTQ